ncbi:MAG: redoxin family protein [Planctomycetota bacterium]|nr:redoxin family protein [Planctomycetota bacterium]
MALPTFAACILGASLLAPGNDVKRGDPAPNLYVNTWIKGNAVDLAKLKGKKIAVVEFWATWCPPCRDSIPHLTKLQAEYAEKDVVIIGVSSEDKLETVSGFVGDWGKKMDYTVAFDEGRKTWDAWMEAAGMGGIPTAFVINKEGKVAWIGDPLDGLDKVLEGLVNGTDSVESKKAITEIQLKAARAMKSRNSENFKELVEEVENLEGGTLQIEALKFHIFVEAGKFEKAKAVGRSLYDHISDDASTLNGFSRKLLTDEPAKGNLNELALQFAVRANELTKGKTWQFLDTLALANFETGSVKEAIELEEKALAMATKAEVLQEQRSELEKALERYRAGSTM